jgi:hypothetical protein
MIRILTLLTALLLTSFAHAQGTIQWAPAALATANTSKTGTSGTIAWVYQNDTEQGVYVDRLVWRAVGTNIQSVGRAFFNNGQPNTTASNNSLFAEETLAATTGSETAAITPVVMDIQAWVPPGGRIFCTVGTTVASGYQITAVVKPIVTEVVE